MRLQVQKWKTTMNEQKNYIIYLRQMQLRHAIFIWIVVWFLRLNLNTCMVGIWVGRTEYTNQNQTESTTRPSPNPKSMQTIAATATDATQIQISKPKKLETPKIPKPSILENFRKTKHIRRRHKRHSPQKVMVADLWVSKLSRAAAGVGREWWRATIRPVLGRV